MNPELIDTLEQRLMDRIKPIITKAVDAEGERCLAVVKSYFDYDGRTDPARMAYAQIIGEDTEQVQP